MTPAETPQQAGRREWIGLAVIALPCLLYSMDLTVLNLALPAISADLRPSSSELLWIVDIYGFLVAGLLITMGTLGDRIGRRRLLLIGAAAFGAASVLAAFASSAPMLIAARALLGVAGATLAPSTLSLIRNMFADPGERTIAIGVWIASFSAGAAIGPLVGGALLELFWWGSVFLIGVPVMALLLVLGPRLLPESRDPDAGRLDLVSAALSLAAVLAVIYALKRLAEDGLHWPPFARRRRRRAAGRAVRAPPAPARRPADRPRAVPDPRVQRRPGHQHARLLRRLRAVRLHRPVPPARARLLAARGRAVDAALGARLHRRRDARRAAARRRPPRVRRRRRPRRSRRSASR